MFPHLETTRAIEEMARREALVAAARVRRAGEAAPVGGRPPTGASGIAHLRGALRGLARRQGGARPALPDGAAASALR